MKILSHKSKISWILNFLSSAIIHAHLSNVCLTEWDSKGIHWQAKIYWYIFAIRIVFKVYLSWIFSSFLIETLSLESKSDFFHFHCWCHFINIHNAHMELTYFVRIQILLALQKQLAFFNSHFVTRVNFPFLSWKSVRLMWIISAFFVDKKDICTMYIEIILSYSLASMSFFSKEFPIFFIPMEAYVFDINIKFHILTADLAWISQNFHITHSI